MKIRSTGRGGGYSAFRGLLESALAVGYQGDWPARLWSLAPGADQVAVTRHAFALPPGESAGCRVTFVSDLHVGPTTPVELLERAFEAVRDERPDVLLLGGDYVFLEAEPRRLAVLGALVRSVDCPIKLAVLGNHDLWTFDRAIVETLTQAGARVLVNETTVLPSPWSDVVVIGLDDPWTGRRDVKTAAAGLGDEAVRIVLCHSPDGLGLLRGLRFDLFLCGHTHGGQVVAPWGPVVLPRGRLCRAYPAGWDQFDSGLVYVSRGVGGVEVPIRTFAPPDVLLLELTRPRAC